MVSHFSIFQQALVSDPLFIMAQREISLGNFWQLQKHINHKFAVVHIFHFLSGTSMSFTTSSIVYANIGSPLYTTYAYASGGDFPGGNFFLAKLLVFKV